MPRKAPNRLALLESEREHQLHLARLQKVKPNTDVRRPASLDLVHLQYNFKRHQQLQGVYGISFGGCLGVNYLRPRVQVPACDGVTSFNE